MAKLREVYEYLGDDKDGKSIWRREKCIVTQLSSLNKYIKPEKQDATKR
jgi:hypothetical protein